MRKLFILLLALFLFSTSIATAQPNFNYISPLLDDTDINITYGNWVIGWADSSWSDIQNLTNDSGFWELENLISSYVSWDSDVDLYGFQLHIEWGTTAWVYLEIPTLIYDSDDLVIAFNWSTNNWEVIDFDTLQAYIDSAFPNSYCRQRRP